MYIVCYSLSVKFHRILLVMGLHILTVPLTDLNLPPDVLMAIAKLNNKLI